MDEREVIMNCMKSICQILEKEFIDEQKTATLLVSLGCTCIATAILNTVPFDSHEEVLSRIFDSLKKRMGNDEEHKQAMYLLKVFSMLSESNDSDSV